jgi:hypothetical protein
MGEVARLGAAVAALAAGIAAVTVAALVLHRTPGPTGTAATPTPPAGAPASPPPAVNGFPAPPAGAVVLAREAGLYALALARLPKSVQVSVVGQQGTGVRGLTVSVNGVTASACGAGCYSAPVSARSLTVQAGSTRWRATLPRRTPDAEQIVTRAAQVWRSLRTLAWEDRLASDPVHAVFSTWQAVAPDRISYRVRGGYDAVIIGHTRWDKSPGGGWVRSAQSIPVQQPSPIWLSAIDAHVVGSTGSGWRITFFDPKTPAWFEIVVDKQTLHTIDLHMTTTAHFMHERYLSFDAPVRVAPPR